MPEPRTAHPLVIGHRGARRRAVENTLESLEIAAHEGADGVEFDVQLTHDGELILWHDDTLQRLTGHPERPAQVLWRDLRGWALQDGVLRAPRVTHLDEVLAWAATHRLQINAELKVDPLDPTGGERLADTFLRHVRNLSLDAWVISSFAQRPLRAVAQQRPDLRLGALVDERPPCDAWALLDAPDQATIRHTGIHPPHGLVTAERVARWRQAGLQVWTWTANAPRDWERLCELHVDAVITDTPDALVAFLARHGKN